MIEVDGGHHFLPENIFYDQEWTNYLESLGLRVIRFTNREVMANLAGVIEMLSEVIKNRG